MRVSINQPYFCPYPGFFYKAWISDVFVILDSVQFPHGPTWITRNRFKNDQGVLRMGVPVWKKGLGFQRINGVRICNEGFWKRKHVEGIKCAYGNAPYLDDHIGFFEDLYAIRIDRLIDMNLFIIRYCMEYLSIDTRIVLLSELDIDVKGDRLPVEICRGLGADIFTAQCQAKKYLDEGLFLDDNIELHYFNIPSYIYPQLWGSFIPRLSIVDMLMNCGPKSRDIILRD